MEIKEIVSEQELLRIIRQGMALILFSAPWFSPCQLQESILHQLAPQFQGKAIIGEVNVDQSPEMAWSLDIRSIPTLILYKNSREILRFFGLQPEDTLSKALEGNLK